MAVKDFNQSFMPAVYLGASVNMLKSSAGVFSVSTLFDDPTLVFTDPEHRAIMPSSDTTDRTLKAPLGILKSIPTNINVNGDEVLTTQDTYVFHSGTDVSNALKLDAKFQAGYMGVTVGASGSYSTASEFKSDQMYAFANKSVTAYVASYLNFDSYNADMVKAAKALPKYDADGTGKAPSNDVVQQYRNFFEHYGTHTITSMSYGWRYQQSVTMSNSSSMSSEDFAASFEIAYLGKTSNVKAETQDQISAFEKQSQAKFVAIGGSAGLANAAMGNPADITAMNSYVNSLGKNDDAGTTGVGVQTLGWLLWKINEDDLGAQLDKALYDMLGMQTRQFAYPVNSLLMIDPANVESGVWTVKTPGCYFVLQDGSTSTTWNQTLSWNGEKTNYLPDNPPPIRCLYVDELSLRWDFEFINLNAKFPSRKGPFWVTLAATQVEPLQVLKSPLPYIYTPANQSVHQDVAPVTVNVAKDAPWNNR